MVAAAMPMRKTSASGARYTSVGRICARSSPGRKKAMTLSFRPAQTPSGSPIASDSATAPSVIARVSIVSVHMPSSPQARSSPIESSEVRRFDVA